MKVIATQVKLICALFPDSRETDLSNRLQRFRAIAHKNKEANMGKNQDYKQGYDIGEYLAAEGEDLDFKDLDQIANELFDDTTWGDLPVANLGYFKDGLSNGYVISSNVEENKDR